MGLESYGSKSGCFEHGEKWVQKLQNRRKEELIEVQREWGAGCYEVTKHCGDHTQCLHFLHSTNVLIGALW